MSLAGQHKNNPLKEVSAVNELNLLVSSVSKLSADKSLRLVGFNEKFFSPKYILPSHPTVLKSFSSYLLNNNYRYSWFMFPVCVMIMPSCVAVWWY